MSIITLTTDFGLKDYFVSALKGKIVSEFLEAKIVDISHDIDPFNIVEASYCIGAAYTSFPKHSVHLIGVDMELNKENQHVALLWNDHYFIAADNGVLSMLLQNEAPQELVNINIYNQLPTSSTNLEVFVKVACHIARGGSLATIGNPMVALKPVTILRPELNQEKNMLKGHVIYIDHFGNAVTNITQDYFRDVAQGRDFEILLRTKSIKTILENYSDIATSSKYDIKNYEGEKLAIFNSAGYLEIAIFRSNPKKVGSAHSLLGLNYHDRVRIDFL